MTEKCPKCGMEEKYALSPRTIYLCGSYDYDQRPGTFTQTPACKRITELKSDIAEQDERISIYLSQSTDRKVLYIADCKKRITDLEDERRRAMVHLEEMKRLYEESTDVDNLVAALTEACQIRLIFKAEGGGEVSSE